MDFAVTSGLTLKPMMMALEAEARDTSDSLMAPTPPWITFTITSSLDSFTRLCFTASTEPCTSALTMIGSSLMLPALIWLNKSSSDNLAFVSSSNLFLPSEINVSAKFLASFSFTVPTRTSPAFGTSLSPRISTGVDGPASLTLRPLSSIMARTFP